MSNYNVVKLFAVRSTKTYGILQEDEKVKTFSTEAEAAKFISHLESAFIAGVESGTKTKTSE
jgi:hypothetical protein